MIESPGFPPFEPLRSKYGFRHAVARQCDDFRAGRQIPIAAPPCRTRERGLHENIFTLEVLRSLFRRHLSLSGAQGALTNWALALYSLFAAAGAS